MIVYEYPIRKEDTVVYDDEIAKAITQYLEVNPRSSIHKISGALSLNELAVFSCVENLFKQQRINRSILSLGNSVDRDCSVFYSLR